MDFASSARNRMELFHLAKKSRKKNGIVSFGVKMSRPAFFYRGDYFKMKYGAKKSKFRIKSKFLTPTIVEQK